MVESFPYNEIIISENSSLRGFTNRVDPEELKWHFDEEDRIIELIEETDWLFQFDDELPLSLNSPIFIPQHKIHRVIKGTNNLKIKIAKHIL